MKTKLKRFGAWLMALALTFAGAGAYGAITTQAELNAAIAAVPVNGSATFELGAGEFTTFQQGLNTTGKSLTFIGAGSDKTTWKYGPSTLRNGPNGGEGGLDYSFDGAGFITFKKVALVDNYTGNDYYRGFVRAAQMSFEDCLFKNMTGEWGSGDVSFVNCTFDVASVCEYCLKTYAGKDFTFDRCTFKSNNKGFIQLYMQDGSETIHKVIVKDCTFVNGAKTSKTPVYFYDQGPTEGAIWDVDFQGDNVNVGNIPVNAKSKSWLWGDMKYNEVAKTVIKINGTVVFENNTVFELPPEDTPVKVDTKDVEVKDAAGNVITDEKAVAAVKEITDAVQAIGLTEKEDTKVEQAVVAGEGESKVVKTDVVEALKTEATTPEQKAAVEAVVPTEVKSYLNIKLESVGVTEAKVAKVVYDVKPRVKVTVVTEGNKKSTIDTVIPNEAIEEKIAFTLPVASFQGTSALVSHFEGDKLIESFFKPITDEAGAKVVALESDRFSTWELVDAVEVAPGFYRNQASTEFYIMDFDGLNSFRTSVNGDETYAGKTVKLMNDIAFSGDAWTNGIGDFKGAFDGCGCKISGLKISAVGNYVGLFKSLNGTDVHLPAIIRNLTLAEPQIESVPPEGGEEAQYVGVFCGGSKWVTIENCTVSGGKVSCVDQVGGIIGFGLTTTVKGCTLDGVIIEARGDRAGGILAKAQYGCNISGNTIKDCTITSAGLNATYCGASAIVAQMWANSVEGGGLCSICDNTIINTTTTSAGDTALVPIGNARDGLETAKCEFLRNHWEPDTAATVDSRAVKCKVGDVITRIEIANFNPVAQIEGKGLAARYESLQEAYAATVDGDTIKILVDFDLTEAFTVNTVGRNNLVIDLNGKTMTLKSVVSTWKNLTFANGSIDVGIPAGGKAGEHAWDKLFYAEHVNCELKFDNVVLTYTNGVSTVGIQTGGKAKLTFKDSTLNFANCDKPIYLGTPGDAVFDHTVLNADKATTYVVHGDYNCGPVIFKGGSSVAMKDCGGLNSNSTFEMSDTTVNATGMKNPLFRNSSVTLVSNAKIFVDGATDMFGYNAYELVVNAGCTFELRNCGYTGAIFNRGGSVFKSGSTVVISNCCVTENTTHACYGKDNAIRACGNLTIEKGANVRLYGSIDAYSGPGTITIADGSYLKLVQSVETETFDLKGGIYHDEPADAFVNPAYEKVANTDEATKAAYPWTIAKKPSVAEMLDAEGQSVGEIYSFVLALEQVPEGGTIKILVDDATFAITDTTKSFKINPNGHELGEITVPTGYELKNNEGVLTFRKTPIATITRETVTTEYATLPAACTAAQSGDVIQLAALEIDATDEYVIKDLTGKTVTIKGAGQDQTTLLWGTGKKWGTGSNSYLTGANITFEDLAVTIAHDSGMPYVQWMDHPASQTFRNVKINGLIVTMDPAVFDGCTFAGPQQNTAKGAPDEYLIWNYGNHAYVTNCTFAATGTHAPIKVYNDSGVKCSLTVVDTAFAAVGDESGAITTASSSDNFAYDIQVDVDSVTVPAGATLIGFDPNYGSKKVNMVNGTTDANGKYTSGAIFSDRGTDEQILAIVVKIVAEGYTALPYTGPLTVLGNFRWYIGPQQLQPTVDPDAEKPTYPPDFPEDKKAENNEGTRQKIEEQTSTVKMTLESAAITKFTDTNVEKTLFDDEGKVTPKYKEALAAATDNQAVKDAIKASSSDSNTSGKIKIDLKEMVVGVKMASAEDVVATLNKVSYDVKPVLVTEVTYKDGDEVKSETVKTEITEALLGGNPITFRLAVGKEFVGKAQVLHYSDDAKQNLVEDYYTPVLGEGENKYVQIKSVKFSPFDVLNANAVQLACKVGDNMYATITDAIAASEDSYDTTIEMLADVGTDVTVEGLGKRVIDTAGTTFEAVIMPDGDLEVVKGSGGKRYLAAPKVEVPTGPSTVMPIRGYVASTDDPASELAGDSTTGNKVWQDYVMFGNEGTRVKLTPEILKAETGSSVVTIKAADGFELSKPVRSGVAVSFQLLKRDGITGNFAAYGAPSATPSFTVDVKEIGPKTYWKIKTIFSCEEEQ